MYIVASIVFIIAGILSLWVGVNLWRNSESLNPYSSWYRYLLQNWQEGPRSRKSKEEGLTPKRIRYYALRNIVGGLGGIAIGLYFILNALR